MIMTVGVCEAEARERKEWKRRTSTIPKNFFIVMQYAKLLAFGFSCEIRLL
jgi:hypothetical protein